LGESGNRETRGLERRRQTLDRSDIGLVSGAKALGQGTARREQPDQELAVFVEQRARMLGRADRGHAEHAPRRSVAQTPDHRRVSRGMRHGNWRFWQLTQEQQKQQIRGLIVASQIGFHVVAVHPWALARRDDARGQKRWKRRAALQRPNERSGAHEFTPGKPAAPPNAGGTVLKPCLPKLLLRCPAGAISVGSMITSITNGPSEASPNCSAAATPCSRSTRMPSAPIPRAMATKSARGKSVSNGVQPTDCMPCSIMP